MKTIISIASPDLDYRCVQIEEFETKDGRHPEAIVAHIAGKAVPLTFDYRTIRYVKRILRECSERGDFE